MKQKILSCFLAAMLLLGSFSITASAYEPNLLGTSYRYGLFTLLGRTYEVKYPGTYSSDFIDRILYNGGYVEPPAPADRAGLYWIFTAPSNGVYRLSAHVLGIEGMNYSFGDTDFTADGTWQDPSVTIPMKRGETKYLYLLSLSAGKLYYSGMNLSRIGEYVQPLENGSFEQGLSKWQQKGSQSFVVTTTDQAYSGKSSACFSYFKNEPRNNYIEQTLIRTGEQNLTMSAYIKTVNLTGQGVYMTLEAYDANGNLLASASNPPLRDTKGGWHRLDIHLSAPKETDTIRIIVGAVQCTGGFYVDDMTLE